MNEITPALLLELKEHLKLTHTHEDAYLTGLLVSSISDLQGMCGVFDISLNPVAKELCMNRARFAYNGELEIFAHNYLLQINNLAFSIQLPKEDEII